MSTTTVSMKQCIENCQECQTACANMLTSHCLSEGGDHVAQTHVKRMLDCIAACAACVDFMSRMMPLAHKLNNLHKHAIAVRIRRIMWKLAS